jgi:histone deacetylase complex subunit SAP30
MPPKKNHDDSTQLLKEKLQGANARDRRNGKAAAANGSSLKEVDNASTNSGQTLNDNNSSNVSLAIFWPHPLHPSLHDRPETCKADKSVPR